jgi:hypothetical protein
VTSKTCEKPGVYELYGACRQASASKKKLIQNKDTMCKGTMNTRQNKRAAGQCQAGIPTVTRQPHAAGDLPGRNAGCKAARPGQIEVMQRSCKIIKGVTQTNSPCERHNPMRPCSLNLRLRTDTHHTYYQSVVYRDWRCALTKLDFPPDVGCYICDKGNRIER